MSQKPTFVLVPGAWHGPETWDKVRSLLEEAKYKSVAVNLPSTLSNPEATFLDDIEAARSAILAETTQGRDVVVVVHSYGGLVGSSAIKGLARPKERVSQSTADPAGHVIGLILIATGFNVSGVSFLGGFGGKPPPSWRADTDSGYAVIVDDPREMFYHDLTVEEGNSWVAKLRKQALKPLAEGGEHSYPGWKDVPCWYLATVEDKGLPIDAQRYFVQMARDAGVDVTAREVKSSHSPMLSRPKETAEFMLEAVESFTRKETGKET